MLKIAKQRSNVKLNTINMLLLVDLRARSCYRFWSELVALGYNSGKCEESGGILLLLTSAG